MTINCKVAPISDNDGFHFITSVIKKAKKRIFASIFIIDSRFHNDSNYEVRTILFELARQCEKKLDVRVIIGISESPGIKLANLSTIKTLTALGIPIKIFAVEDSSKSLHTKFLIADDSLIIGSHNWAHDAFNNFVEDSVHIVSSKLSSKLSEYFNEIWSTSISPPENQLSFPKLDNKSRRVSIIKDTTSKKLKESEATLLVNDYYVKFALEKLSLATKNVQITMFFMTGTSRNSIVKPLIDKLLELNNKGIKIQVLLDTDDEGDVYGSRMINRKVAKLLDEQNIEVRFDDPNKLLHSKIVLIDENVTIIGSHNWTQSSFSKYEEISVGVESPDLNKYFKRRFNALWNVAEPYSLTLKEKPMDPQKNSYETSSISPYQYWAKVIEVIDGDTIDCEVELGFELTYKARIRLLGISAPEIFGVKKNTLEYRNGIKAKEFLKSLIPNNKWVELRVYQSSKREKYGRWLAEIYSGKTNLNMEMIKSNHAVKYQE